MKALFVAACAVLFAGWLGLSGSVNLHHVKPDPVTGRVYPWNSHGIVYVTEEERSTLRMFEGVFVAGWAVAFGIAGLITFRRRRIDDQKYVRPKTEEDKSS